MALRVAALALATSSAAFALPSASRPRLMESGHHDTSPPLWVARPIPITLEEDAEHEPLRIQIDAPSAPVRDPVIQSSVPALLSLQTGLNFEGIGDGLVSTTGSPFAVPFSPPDPPRVSGALVTFEPGARTAWRSRTAPPSTGWSTSLTTVPKVR